MEACGSAHYWAREIQKLGHQVVLLPPHHVRPYIRRNKTDRTDAKGILEASRNDDIRPVPVKTVAQQVLTSLHRLRSGWMLERTARLNTLRGLLRELGVFIPVGSREVVPAVWAAIEDADSDLPDALRSIFAEACREIREIEARIKQVERQLEAWRSSARRRATPDDPWHRASDRDGAGGLHRRHPTLPIGRHLASYLGLTPREYSSGLKRNLGRISKRGDGYLRTLLIHGARSVLVHARKQQPDRLREWAHNLAKTHVPQQGRGGRGEQARSHRLGRLDARKALRTDGEGLPEQLAVQRIEPLTQELQDATSVTVKQVGPAQGQPITIVAFEAVVIDWLPGARIPSWPGALGGSSERGRRYVCSPPRFTEAPPRQLELSVRCLSV